ncbi:carbamoyltransferase [Balneolales bacterium ANBcel1]|nr:carbamoyltransferase [Balneolales bacterium ANBcel1]
MKKILGISAFYHDSAAALVSGSAIVAAAQEERFTRSKHTAEFPVNAIRYCLEEGGLTIDELDAVVFYDKPLLKFERLLETYYAFAPRGLVSFLKAIPLWLREKMFLKKMVYDGLREIGPYDLKRLNLRFTEHHLSHAASAFYPSPYPRAAILTIDGVGEWATAAIGIGDGRQITFLRELEFPHSVGLLYSAFTYYLGFRVNSGEYKLMGLAPYGDPESAQVREFMDVITGRLTAIKPDGSLWMNQNYFSYATGLRMVRDRKWEQLFGFPRREPDHEILQHHCNLALAIQKVTEEIVLKMAREARKLTGETRLCMAGGVALNCVANGLLLRERVFEEVFIQPCSGDAGGALGAALAAAHLYYDIPLTSDKQARNSTGSKTEQQGRHRDTMAGAYLGPSFSDKEIIRMLRHAKAVYRHVADFDELADLVARDLADGKVAGWFQGRMEYGPRALGNRSILADARNPEMQKKLNLKIKFREGFRPFAPSVPAEDAGEYFDLSADSPYMLFTAPVREQHRIPVPDDYHQKPLNEKLYHPRSNLQAITHVDFSARIQTVHEETNPRFAALLRSFKKLTGCALLVNTSFNVRGEPIVCTPEDAWRCFMGTDMDLLVIGNFLMYKTEQPDHANREKWRRAYAPD